MKGEGRRNIHEGNRASPDEIKRQRQNSVKACEGKGGGVGGEMRKLEVCGMNKCRRSGQNTRVQSVRRQILY